MFRRTRCRPFCFCAPLRTAGPSHGWASEEREREKKIIRVTDHSDMELLRGEEGKTQMLAPGLKCARAGGEK